MSEPKKYHRQAYLNRVIKHSGAKYSALSVLYALCHVSEFDAPTSKITKEQIHWLAGGLGRKYIMRGFRELKEAGVIKVVRNEQGGRSIAPTYSLHIRSMPKPGSGGGPVGNYDYDRDEILRKAGFRVRKPQPDDE